MPLSVSLRRAVAGACLAALGLSLAACAAAPGRMADARASFAAPASGGMSRSAEAVWFEQATYGDSN